MPVKLFLIATLLSGSWLLAACAPTGTDAADARAIAQEQTYNDGWAFLRSDDLSAPDQARLSTHWQRVTLPHTPKIDPLIVNDQIQGAACYRKMIAASAIDDGKPVWLRFE